MMKWLRSRKALGLQRLLPWPTPDRESLANGLMRIGEGKGARGSALMPMRWSAARMPAAQNQMHPDDRFCAPACDNTDERNTTRTQYAAASQDNNLGTRLGDRCRVPEGLSGRLKVHLEECREGA
jgi:hypothetical protein